MPVTSPRGYFWLIGYKFGSFHSLLVKFYNSLEWLTELRKALYSLLPVYSKGCNSGRAKWKRCIGRGVEGRGGAGCGAQASLPSQGSPVTLMCSPTRKPPVPKFRGFYGGFIAQAWSINSLAIGDWTLSPAPSPSLEIFLGTALKLFSPLPVSHLISTQKTLLVLWISQRR